MDKSSATAEQSEGDQVDWDVVLTSTIGINHTSLELTFHSKQVYNNDKFQHKVSH